MRCAAAPDARTRGCRIVGWTRLIGMTLLAAALANWLILEQLAGPALAALFAAGAGGMFYLTVTDLVPETD